MAQRGDEAVFELGFRACPVCAERRSTVHFQHPDLTFVRCASCGLIYKSTESADLRARLAKKYDASYFQNGRAQYLARWNHRVAKCKRQLLACLSFARAATRVLDVGCSAGYVVEAGAQLGCTATGMDYAKFSAELASRLGIGASVGSMTELPYRDGAFDVITAKHTLEHVDAPLEALREVHRALAPGGVAFVIVPDASYWRVALLPGSGQYFRPEGLGWQHHVYYDVHTLQRAMEAAGFGIVSTDKAVFRRQLAVGAAWPYEVLRFAVLKVWTSVARALRLRREIQVIGVKAGPTQAG